MLLVMQCGGMFLWLQLGCMVHEHAWAVLHGVSAVFAAVHLCGKQWLILEAVHKAYACMPPKDRSSPSANTEATTLEGSRAQDMR